MSPGSIDPILPRIGLVFLGFALLGLALARLPLRSGRRPAGDRPRHDADRAGSAWRKAPGYLMLNLVFLSAMFAPSEWAIWGFWLLLLLVAGGLELLRLWIAATDPGARWCLTWLALVYLPAGLWSLFLLHQAPDGPHRLAFLYLCVAAHDAFAQLIGARWGRRALAGRISPHKTWEGAAGGLLAAILMGLLLAPALPPSIPAPGLLAATFAVASLLGDLATSTAKRRAGIKDFGTLLGAQGGVMDRLDGLVLAAVLGLVLQNVGLW